MNNQEFYNISRKHLLKQMSRSTFTSNISGSQTCAYRGYKGKTCAIGCAIPDEKYQIGMENTAIEDLILYCNEIHDLFINVEMTLLQDMQRLHDGTVPEFWLTGLDKIAFTYQIEIDK